MKTRSLIFCVVLCATFGLSSNAYGALAKPTSYIPKSGTACRAGYTTRTLTKHVGKKVVRHVECVLIPPSTTTIAKATTTTPAPRCAPISNEGTCYEPGEYCRNSDHGVTGVAGDGKRITCENNDGWRWEPT